jgi:hypothetical protein
LTNESTSQIALLVRQQSGSNSCYALVVQDNYTHLYVVTNGSYAEVGSPVEVVVGTYDVWTLQAAGSVLITYQNGKRIRYDSDTTYTGGSPGFSQYSTTNITHTNVGSWRGYSLVQQDGVWQKQGITIPAIAADYASSGYGLYQNSKIFYEGNAHILSGTVYKTWATGDALWGTPAQANIYYFESLDGITWSRYATPVITGGYLTPMVIKSGSYFYLYAQAGPGSTTKYAVWRSTDGINWGSPLSTDIGISQAAGWESAWTYEFCPVVIIAGTWYGLYTAGTDVSTLVSGGIGLATSTDGVSWAKYGSNPLAGTAGLWNSNAIAQVGTTWYMWCEACAYGQNVTEPGINPAETVRIQSADLIIWTNPVHSVHHSQLFEGVNNVNGQSMPNAIIDIGGKAHLYTTSASSDSVAPGDYQIGLAIADGPIASVVQANEDGVAQIATDAFAGTDGSLGANWTTPTGATALQVASHLVEPSTTAADCTSLYTGASFGNDQYSEVTISALTINNYLSPVVRGSTTASTLYKANINQAGTKSIAIGIYREVAGASTLLGSYITMTPQVGDVIRLSAVGNIISLFQNGFLLCQVQDLGATAITSGAPGITLYITSGGLTNNQVSKWAGGNANSMPFATVSGNAGVAGATVSYTGAGTGSVTADGSGNYSLIGLLNGSYTITPSKTGYTFASVTTPYGPTQAETVIGADITGVNFTATQSSGGSAWWLIGSTDSLEDVPRRRGH